MATYAQNQSPPPVGNYPQQQYYQRAISSQYPQQGPQGPQGQPQSNSNPNAPQRVPSFTPLPPIRRTSTFGASLRLSLDSPGGFSADIDNQLQQAGNQNTHHLNGAPPANEPAPPPMAGNPNQTQQAVGAYGAQGPQGPHHHHFMMPGPPPPGMPLQNVYRPTMAPGPGAPPPPGPQGIPRSKFANGPAPQGAGASPGPHPPASAMGAQGSMMPPHANRFPPQQGGSGWQIQESHLSQPLNQTHRHRSSPSDASSQQQQPYYGLDKETGVPSTTEPEDIEEQPTNPPQQPNQVPPHSQIGHALSHDQGPGPNFQQPLGPPIARTDTNQSDLPPPGSVHGDDSRNRRHSGIFSGLANIKGRITGHPSTEENHRRDSFGPRQQGPTGDGVSEASFVMEEGGQKKRNTFSRLRTTENAADSQAPHSQESIIAHGPSTPRGETPTPSFPPPEKKRSFFGNITGEGSAPGNKLKSPRNDTARNSLSSSGDGGASKRGFSALVGKFRPSNGKGSGIQEQPKPAGPSPPAPNMFGPPSHGPPGQLQHPLMQSPVVQSPVMQSPLVQNPVQNPITQGPPPQGFVGQASPPGQQGPPAQGVAQQNPAGPGQPMLVRPVTLGPNQGPAAPVGIGGPAGPAGPLGPGGPNGVFGGPNLPPGGPNESPPGDLNRLVEGFGEASNPQAGFMAPPPPIGRGRSDSTSSNPSASPSTPGKTNSVTFALPQQDLPQQGTLADVDKARKTSGGIFGFGRLKKSDVKLGEPSGQSPVAGPAAPGQGPPNPAFLGPMGRGQPSLDLNAPAQVQLLPNQSMGRGQGPPEQQNMPGPGAPALRPASQGPMGQRPSSQGPSTQLPSSQGPPPQLGRGQSPPGLTPQGPPPPNQMGRGQPSLDQMGRGQLPPGQMAPAPGQQQLGRGQLPAFPPGQIPGPYGVQMLGPDGKPIVLQGQFNPSTGQFVVLLPPGVPPPVGGQFPMMPFVPGSMPHLPQPSVLSPVPQSRPSSQQGESPTTVGPSHPAQPQLQHQLSQPHINGVHSHSPLSQSVSASDNAQPHDSPVSQRSQLAISPLESRGSLNTTPVQYKQAVPPPPPGPPTRKPVRSSQDGSINEVSRGHRSSSVSSQQHLQPPAQPAQGSQNAEQLRRVSNPQQQRLSAQESPQAGPPGSQAGSSPRQSIHSVHQSPNQQFNQQFGQTPGGPQGPQLAPGQSFPPGQLDRASSYNSNASTFPNSQPGQPTPPGQPGFQGQPGQPNPNPPNGFRPPAPATSATGTSTAAPKEEKQSTFSKLLKGAHKPGEGKEKKSLFNFRRSEHKHDNQSRPPQHQPQAQPALQNGQQMPPSAQLLQPQLTGPQPLRPQFTGPQPLRPQNTGPQMVVPQPYFVQQQASGLSIQPQRQSLQPGQNQAPGAQPNSAPGHPQQQVYSQQMRHVSLPHMVPQMGRGVSEPQYAQVPIPRSYGYVHAEGGLSPAPAPYLMAAPMQGYALPPGQVLHPGMMQQQQMWTQQGVRPGWAAPMPGQQMNLSASGGPTPNPNQQTPPPAGSGQQTPQPDASPLAQGPRTSQQTTTPMPSLQHSPPGQGLQPSPASPQPSVPSQVVSPASVTAPDNHLAARQEYGHPSLIAQTETPTPPPQLRHPGSPQGYPVPESGFSPINPDAINAPNPPLPQGVAVAPQGQDLEGGLLPQRQPSAVSQMSLQPGNQPQASQLHSPVSHVSPAAQSPHTPSPQITPDRAVSPEPAHPTHPAPAPATLGMTLRDSRTDSSEQKHHVFPPLREISMTIQPPPASEQREPPMDSYRKHTSHDSKNSLQPQPQTPRNIQEDNIYDATPRTTTVPEHYREDTPLRNGITAAEPKSPGPSRETTSPASVAAVQPTITPMIVPPPVERLSVQSTGNSSTDSNTISDSSVIASPRPRTSAAAGTNGTEDDENIDNADTPPITMSTARTVFEEAKRQHLLREQEEKIPVLDPQPDPVPVKKEDELPQMSATSYPGQEWNPYEAGFGDWEE